MLAILFNPILFSFLLSFTLLYKRKKRMQRLDLLSKSNLLDTYFDTIPRDIVNLLADYVYHRIIITDNDGLINPELLNSLYVNDMICTNMYIVFVIDNRLYFAGDISALFSDIDISMPTPIMSLNMLLDKKSNGMSSDHQNILSSLRIQKVECGIYHIAILTIDKKLYTIGTNVYGVLGIGSNEKRVINLIDENVEDVSVGNYHTIYSKNGKYYSFGRNEFGECGVGHDRPVNIPTLVRILKYLNVRSFYCRESISVFITDDELYMCGENFDGLISTYYLDFAIMLPSPIYMSEIPEKISIGRIHLGMIINKQLYMKGSNNNGQLGLSILMRNLDSLTHMKNFEDQIVEDIICAGDFSIVKVSGIFYGTGNNCYNQLGLPELKDYHAWTPLPINNININITKISACSTYVGYLI
jgi:hypothetical protein